MNMPSWREGLKAAAVQALPGTAVQRITLVALLLVASALRLWDLPNIPYTHEEISALIRVYPSLGETVQQGVAALDTHPPGVQVFEWAWTKLFGMSEAAVKLPFILISLLALLLLYRFAFAWCGPNVALIMTALLATIQYTVMYGQVAQPYAAGLFTTALLADQLTRYLGSGSRKALVGTALAAVLSAYTHHFASMLAVIMLLTGSVLIVRAKRREYLIACALAAVAYLPNIPILLKQSGVKILDGWVATPTTLWVPDYLWWLAHCSVLFAAMWALLIVASVALRIRYRGGIAPLWAITLLWGVLPLLVGYGYSLWRSPVLQYSVVLFSFPYLLLGTLAGLRYMRGTWVLPAAFVTAAVSVFTLITERKHYEIFYASRYEAITHGIIEASTIPDRIALLDGPDRMVDFYLKHWGLDRAKVPYFSIHDRSAAWLDSLLGSTTASSAFYGANADAVPEHTARIQAAFPFMQERHDMDEGQTFLFSAIPVNPSLDDKKWGSLITPDAIEGDGWEVNADLPLWQDTTDQGRSPRAWDLTGQEFGILLNKPIYQIAQGDNDVIEARMNAVGVDGNGLKLVMELKEGDLTAFYRSQAFQSNDSNGSIFCAIPLADLPGHGQGQRLRVYLWNEGGRAAHVASMEVRVREGNPWLYGFFEPLKGPLRFP